MQRTDMVADASVTTTPVEARILRFARAFRNAARAVGFYPPAHPAVGASIEHVAAAARAATEAGPVVLTILPDVFLVGGAPVESRESTIAELADILHRHGIGALSLKGGASIPAWRALFELLALPPDDVRTTGGIQRRWFMLRHPDPVILEIDFREMLRGRVGGDFGELAGVINHYLEIAGVGTSFADDPYAVLLAALDGAADDESRVAALVAELRSGVQLIRMTQSGRFDQVMRDASRIGEHLSEAAMAGFLAQRAKTEAIVGTVNIVTALIDRMSDATARTFLERALIVGDGPSTRLVEVFATLVPNVTRRRVILATAREGAAAGAPQTESRDKWADLERQSEAFSARQFVSDEYAQELQAAQTRSEDADRMTQDPPERIAAWVHSLDDGVVDELDLRLLEDLVRLEHEPDRLEDVLGMVLRRVLEAADSGDWNAAERLTHAVSGVAHQSADTQVRTVATRTLRALEDSAACEQVIAVIGSASAPPAAGAVQFLLSVGPALIPRIVRRWLEVRDAPARTRLESVVADFDRAGREALRKMLSSSEAAERTAAITLLGQGGASDHLGALEALLSDPDRLVRAEAFGALLRASSERAHEVLARGIARVTSEQQAALIAEVVLMAGDGAVPVLRRLVAYLDQSAVDAQVYLSVISGLKRAGGEEAAAALRLVFKRGSWRTPLRTLKFRSAARRALRGMAAVSSGAKGDT
ncbi:MAG: HEAT repeat domain-containing protein [Acidobacteriota bacterium]